jgi:predicted Zn-dependent peptidase
MTHSTKKLKNGLRYLFVHRPEMETVTVMVLVGTGSDYETKEKNGLAHFLEHMCFKGTIKRPNSLIIDREFESMGADYNAFTSNEYTGYYAKGQSSDASALLEICSDIFLNSTFPEAEIVKEKGVVIEEINMYEDDPKSKVHNILEELLYGDQPAGRPISGTKETVASFNREDLINYHREHYTPSNTLVVVAGNFNRQKIAKQIENDFSKSSKRVAPKKTKTQVSQNDLAKSIFYKDSEQAHILLAFHTFNRKDKNTKIVG